MVIRWNRIIGVPFLLAVIMMMNTAFCFAATGNLEKTLTKEYTFTTYSENDMAYKTEKEFNHKGHMYKLDNIRYEVISKGKPITLKKHVRTSDTNDYQKSFKQTVKGTEYTFNAKTPNWKQVQVIPYETLVKQFATDTTVSKSITSGNIVYDLVKKSAGTKKEKFKTPAIFRAETTNADQYWIGDRLVDIDPNGNAPTWKGYKEDIKRVLNMGDSIYTITGIEWDGGFKKADNGYIRHAIVSGVKIVDVINAVYSNENYVNSHGSDVYEADITYIAENSAPIKVKAIATYELEKEGLSLGAKIAIGCGIAIVILALASLLYFLAKKRKEEGEEVTE